jgi:mRNA-degrading endonuclease RelE of RelBE toxin-antitoxin system
MADKITKFLRKLSNNQYAVVVGVIDQILRDELILLDVKKLAGRKNFFRVRVGRIRIVFSKNPNGNRIELIANRDDQTYRDF